MKCPCCNQEIEEHIEYTSMIDNIVASMVRELVCMKISEEVGIPYPDAKQYLIEAIKEMNEAPENIRCWFERMM